jgi:ribosomal protein L32
MSEDASPTDNGPEIVVCPHCGELTPKGIYCANCGRALARQPVGGDWLSRPATTSPGEVTGTSVDPDLPDEPLDVPDDSLDLPVEFDGDAEVEYDDSLAEDPGVDAFEDEPGAASRTPDDDIYRDEPVEDPDADDADVIDGEVLDSIVPYKNGQTAEDSRFTPALERTRRIGGSLAKAVSIGGAEGDPIHEALERRGRRPLADYRRLAGIVSLAVLVALLLNNSGIAILLSVFLVPVLTLLYLTDLDLYEREPWPAILGALGAGAVLGLLFGTIGAWLTGAFWIEGASFYAGAAGYGARFAEAEGSPPFIWILLGGVVIPAIVVIACAIAPVFMRRWPVLRNEMMDGVTLGAATGSGYAAATAVVHFWPAIVQGQNPGGDVSDWTATLVGLIVLRPLIYGALAAVLCAAIWQYAVDQRASSLTRGVVAGVGGIVIFSIVDLLIQPAGAAAELLWHLVVILVLWFVTRSAIRGALRHDALTLKRRGHHVFCPNCGQSTPDGSFCAHCGAPLHPAEAAAT